MGVLRNEQQAATCCIGDSKIAKHAKRCGGQENDRTRCASKDYADYCEKFTIFLENDGNIDVLDKAIGDDDIENVMLLLGNIDDVPNFGELVRLIASLVDRCRDHTITFVLDDFKSASLVVATTAKHKGLLALDMSVECLQSTTAMDSEFMSAGDLNDECKHQSSTLRLKGCIAFCPSRGLCLTMMCGDTRCVVHFPDVCCTQDSEGNFKIHSDVGTMMDALQTCVHAHMSTMKGIDRNVIDRCAHSYLEQPWVSVREHISSMCESDPDDDMGMCVPPRILGDNQWCRINVDQEKEATTEAAPLHPLMERSCMIAKSISGRVATFAAKQALNGSKTLAAKGFERARKSPKNAMCFAGGMMLLLAVYYVLSSHIGIPDLSMSSMAMLAVSVLASYGTHRTMKSKSVTLDSLRSKDWAIGSRFESVKSKLWPLPAPQQADAAPQKEGEMQSKGIRSTGMEMIRKVMAVPKIILQTSVSWAKKSVLFTGRILLAPVRFTRRIVSGKAKPATDEGNENAAATPKAASDVTTSKAVPTPKKKSVLALEKQRRLGNKGAINNRATKFR
jgi:hypothetical protein